MRVPRRDTDRAQALVACGKITREKSCEHKQSFPNQNDARHACKNVFAKTGRQAVSYKCQFCQQYHVSKLKHGEDAAA